MDGSIVLRLIAGGLILLGITLVSNPELVSNKPVPEDTFEATERRIWWGLIIGFGFLLMFHHQWLSWSSTIAATLTALLVGLLVARLIGIALDGSVIKQWINVGIELVILVPLCWWYLKSLG